MRYKKLLKTVARRPGATTLLLGYFAQGYGAIVALLFAPFVLNAVGAEAYGLVGIQLVLQAWFQLLDAGLTPAVTRESARYRGGAVSSASLVNTLKGLESIVFVSSLPILLIAWFTSFWLAERWLKSETLTVQDMATAFQLMTLIVLMRWVSGVRRGLLIGFERHTSIYLVNIAVATLRYPCIVLYFAWVVPTSTHYFLYQVGISFFEVLLLLLLCRKILPDASRVKWLTAIKSLRSIAGFALSHVFLALVWILILQTDKLLLARYLQLSHFGYFTLAAAAAHGVNLILLPIGQLIKPKLSRLEASNEAVAMVYTYRRFTRVAVVSVSGVTVLFLFFAQEVLMVWTNNADFARVGQPVLVWYSLGNAALALSTFAYYLQYARGDLRLHTWGTVGFLIVIVPALFYSTKQYGLTGASITWAVFWVLYLLSWVTWTHRLLLQRLHWRWLFSDVLAIFLPVLVVGALMRQLVDLPDSRILLSLVLLMIWLFYSVLALSFSRLVPLRRWYKRFRSQFAGVK